MRASGARRVAVGFSCERYRHIRGSGREWTVEVAYTGDTQLLASIKLI